jgi:hypothetical protein
VESGRDSFCFGGAIVLGVAESSGTDTCETVLMAPFRTAVHRAPISRVQIILGATLAMLAIQSNEKTRAASPGCTAINALPVQHLAPSGQYGRGIMGTWSVGDAITLYATPQSNIDANAAFSIESYYDNRWAIGSGNRATFVIAPSETNAWLAWGIWANGNRGGLTVTIFCTPSNPCPTGEVRLANGACGCPPGEIYNPKLGCLVPPVKTPTPPTR